MSRFRFQDLEVWKLSIEMADALLDVADELENRKMYRFAEQFRGAVLSVSNNIAEGAGSHSDKEFFQYLNIAHRSAFEIVNMLIIFQRRRLLTEETVELWLVRIELLCRKISSLKKTLL